MREKNESEIVLKRLKEKTTERERERMRTKNDERIKSEKKRTREHK